MGCKTTISDLQIIPYPNKEWDFEVQKHFIMPIITGYYKTSLITENHSIDIEIGDKIVF